MKTIKIKDLQPGDKFQFDRTENRMPGVFTLLNKGPLCEFGNDKGGGKASGDCDVIPVK